MYDKKLLAATLVLIVALGATVLGSNPHLLGMSDKEATFDVELGSRVTDAQEAAAHDHSIAWSLKRADYSYLKPNGDKKDRRAIICDASENGRRAIILLEDNDRWKQALSDPTGAGGGCGDGGLSYNAGGHMTCQGYWDGQYRRCGSFSNHGS